MASIPLSKHAARAGPCKMEFVGEIQMNDHAGWSYGQQDTVTAAFARAVKKHGDRIFLDFSGRMYTYAEADRESSRLAHGLSHLGVKRGDTVATVLDNNLEAVLVWFAINKLGAISVPVNTALKGEFLRYQLDDSAAQILIAEPDYAQRIADVADGIGKARVLLQRGGTPVRSSKLAVSPLAGAFVSSDAVIEDANKPGDLMALIYTGGTTGPSKGCMISHNYACNMARQVVWQGDWDENVINWNPLPLYHFNAIASTVVSCMLVGARASIFPRFSVSKFWPEIERSQANVVNLLGSMIAFIGDAPDTDVSRRCFGRIRDVRGTPFPAEMQQKWRERFGIRGDGIRAYALTEAARITLSRYDEEVPPGSSGRRIPDFDVRIVDDDDKELPPLIPGEIIVRPLRPHIMFEGYWNRPADTLKVLKNLWFHTGDIGKFDEQGFLYFVDRKKDYLRRGGENISSYEIENAFRAHPDIIDLAAHAVFSESSEDELKLTVVLGEGSTLTEEALCRWSIDRVPYYAIPRYIEFRADLPRNAVGRVLKYQLRDEGRTPATWDRTKSTVAFEKR